MVQLSLENCGLYKLLMERKNNVAYSLSGILISIEPEVGKTLEYIKSQFPNFTEHGIQHSLRIINYIYSITSKEMKENISDIEIFCFIMSAFFHDIGMTLSDVKDKENQRANHHMYARKPIEQFFLKYIQVLPEKKRLERCISFVCEAHGRRIEDLYNDSDFRKVDTIQGQTLRYGLLAIFLRIGDLMDLEESRVSEFNMHINSEYYNNPISQLHNKRHLDEITYNYSPDKIIINVLTDDREKYKIWFEWLSYLDKEIMFANTHYLVRDNSEFFVDYKLPEVVKSVNPCKNAKFAVEEIRFQLDDTGALWDIITKSVYTNEFDYVRELIQNAIDATLLKVYLDDKVNIKYKSPRSWDCKKKVMVAFSEKEETLWIEDYGIGMNENELSDYLFKTANSGYKHMKRRKFTFPGIAKFGIGFVACLTKANKIQILTKTQNDNCISAEIESRSTIAFIEKNIQRDWQGTTVILKIKGKSTFNEIQEYICSNFNFPSIAIDLIDVDKLHLYMEEKEIQKNNKKMIEIVEYFEQKRNSKIDYILPNYKLLSKLTEILWDNIEIEDIVKKIRDILDNNIYDNELVRYIKNIANNIDANKEGVNKLKSDVSSQRQFIENKMKQYPRFLFSIYANPVDKIVDYKQMILELDNKFKISKIYKNNTKSNAKMGIIYVPTSFTDYDLGIEWKSVNIFMFNNNRIVKNIIKVASDTEDGSIFAKNIISIDEIADADYEMNDMLQEERDEDYYGQIVSGCEEIEYKYDLTYDIILLKNNNFYEVTDVKDYMLNDVDEMDDFSQKPKFLEKIIVPEKYAKERFLFSQSKLYQDGILLNCNPQCIVPLGVSYAIVNLTAEARLELNVSRHELNNNREIISGWVNNVGCIIQRHVAKNCARIFIKNGLDFKIEDLFSQDDNNLFAKECLLGMKDILKEELLGDK